MKRSYVSQPICMMFFALLLTFAQPQAFSQSRSATNELAKSERELSNLTTQEERFYLTTKLASLALAAGETAKATTYSNWLLEQAPGWVGDWNYGNAIHVAHLVLGEVALNAGDLPEAKRQLLEAAKIPGSPQLDTFGPNMRLAQQLLAKGEREIVFQYFNLCAKFWEDSRGQLETWKAAILKGEEPKFGANLLYQFDGFQ